MYKILKFSIFIFRCLLYVTCILYLCVILKNYMCLYVNVFEMYVIIYDSRYV